MNRFISSIIIGAVALTSSAQISIEGVAQYVYPANRAASAGLSFMPDGLSYVQLSDGAKKLDKHNVVTGKFEETILDVNTTRGERIESIGGYTFSADGTKILVYEKSEAIYRHSFWAKYYIYDCKRNTLKLLSETHPRQQAPTFSPDGRMVAFMADDNNIYIHKVDYGSEVAVTTDGMVNSIINGVPDWVYQEEFETYRSMEWAPDNSTLSYLRYDESNVPAFSFPLYEGACDPMRQYALYPGQFTYKYPVAGEPNSKVTLHSYDVDTRKIKDISLLGTDVEYIPSMHYGPEASQLIVTTLNRDQNRLDFVRVNPKSTVAESIHQEKSNAWILPECYESVTYEKDCMVIFSNRTGYSHLYKLGYNGNDLGAITSGEYDVTAYYGRTATGDVYYQSAEQGPINRVIVKRNAKGNKEIISPLEGWSSATFAPGMSHYVLNHSTAAKAPVYTLVATGKDKSLRTLEDNSAVMGKFGSAPVREFFTIQSGGESLNCYLIKPKNFNPQKKYPVIMRQYSGPGSQSVTNSWGIDWMQYAAEHGYVVACVDGRGTGARGRAFEQIVYKNLGHYETIDQNALLSWLQGQSWVDAKRIGMCGWSYGGYETLMAVSSGADYAAAVAIAPVTSWRYYDTIYAERYMTTPKQNEQGYDRSAPINRVSKMNSPILLMSGTADDNVHLSNTMELTARMIGQNKTPDMLLFPNMNHSIMGCNTRAVVYGRMLLFFSEKLGK